MKLQTLFEYTEPTATTALTKVAIYLSKNLGKKLILVPGVEHYTNANERGWGLRYLERGGLRCIRFNWRSEGQVGKITSIMSIDIFLPRAASPSYSISVEGLSMMQTLPTLLKILQKPAVGKDLVFPVDAKEVISGKLDEGLLLEIKSGTFSGREALDDFLDKLASGVGFTRSEFIVKYHIEHVGLFDAAFKKGEEFFNIDRGTRITLLSNSKLNKLKKSLESDAGVMTIIKGPSKESQLETDQEKAVGDGKPKVTFVETLEHLEGLVQALIRGAFNALFVCGAGGVGKTHTVEKVLHEEGLTDGAGYFKNTGAVSPIGLYLALYHNRNDIILFDDSDRVFRTEDSRNILKGATDTKKVRKISWNTKSSSIYHPDQAEEFKDDPSMAPSSFEFKGKIIYVSNLGIDEIDPDGALRTRGYMISVDPSNEEIYDYMEKILMEIPIEGGRSMDEKKRREVFDVVKKSTRKDVSIRKLVRALNLAATGIPNWAKFVEHYA